MRRAALWRQETRSWSPVPMCTHPCACPFYHSSKIPQEKMQRSGRWTEVGFIGFQFCFGFFQSQWLPQSQPLAEMEKVLLSRLAIRFTKHKYSYWWHFQRQVKGNILRRCQVQPEAHGEVGSWQGIFPALAEKPAMQVRCVPYFSTTSR